MRQAAGTAEKDTLRLQQTAVLAAARLSVQTVTQVTQPLMGVCMQAAPVQVQEVQEVGKVPTHLHHLRRHRLGTEALAEMAAAVLAPVAHPSSRTACQRAYLEAA